MKFLHTSDWHLGHTLYGYDRDVEQQDMLNQIKEIIKTTQPDVMVLSGDVYHTSQPSAAVQTMFSEAIVAMHDACPSMIIVATAGNHDSGSKHEIFQTPWRALKVHTIGNIDKEHPENHIIEVPGKGWVVAMPYAYERNIPEGFFQQALDLVSERNTQGLPVIMMAHTTVSGCNFKGHEDVNEKTVGGIDSLEVSALGTGYDYLALGHIHHAQFIHDTEKRVRYCGSPLAVSFDEDYDHSVSIVEIDKHGDTPQVETITIKPIRPLVSLPRDSVATWDEVKKLLEDFPSNNPAYIRLNVEVEDFLPVGANEEAQVIAANKECKVCHINTKRPERKRSQDQALTVQELQQIAPIEIAKRYISNLNSNVPFDDDMEAMFREAQEAVNQEKNK